MFKKMLEMRVEESWKAMLISIEKVDDGAVTMKGNDDEQRAGEGERAVLSLERAVAGMGVAMPTVAALGRAVVDGNRRHDGRRRGR